MSVSVPSWAALVACLAASAPPDDDKASEIELGTVVRATRDREAVPDSVDVLEAERWTDSGRVISDVLQSVPGVSLRRTGSNQSFTSVSLRGLSGRSVAVVLDEVPLTSATLVPIDLAFFDLDELNSIEVYRGSGPVRFPAPLGGMIRLRSKQPEGHHLRAHAGVGSFLEYRLNGTYADQLGPGQLSLRLGGITGRFDYPYYDDGGTTFTDVDDSERRRENNQQRRVNARLSYELPRSSGSARAWGWVVDREQGVPGPGSANGVTATSEDAQALLRLSRDRWELGPTTLNFGLDLLTGMRRLDDPDQSLGLGTQSSTQRLAQLAGDLRFEYRLNDSNALDAALRLSAYRYRIESTSGLILDEVADDRDSLALGSGIEWSTNLITGVDLFARLRGDVERLSGDTLAELSPTGGATAVVGPCRFHTLAGRRHRLPTLLERFGDNVLTIANADLQSESALTADLGARCGDPSAFLELTGFTLNARDLIVLVQNSQQSVRAENVGRARVDGLEALGFLERGPASLRVAYSLSDGRDVSTDSRIPGLATHHVNGTAELAWGRARFGWVVDFVSQRTLASNDLRPVPARVLQDAFIRVNAGARFEIHAALFNLTDTIRDTLTVPGAAAPVTAGLSDFSAYPISGRTAFLGLTYRSDS